MEIYRAHLCYEANRCHEKRIHHTQIFRKFSLDMKYKLLLSPTDASHGNAFNLIFKTIRSFMKFNFASYHTFLCRIYDINISSREIIEFQENAKIVLDADNKMTNKFCAFL